MAMDYEKMTDEELCKLAFALHEGEDGEEPDYKEAAKVIKIAADRGSAAALTDYGVYLMNGDGVEKDEKAAVECWKKAALQDFAPAQYKLGVCYTQGVCGLDKNDAMAARYFIEAAEGGIPDAMFNLAIFYGNGIGVAADGAKSMEYLQKAVMRKQPEACYYLGSRLVTKENRTEEETLHGAALLLESAESGYPEAQFIYGMCCHEGRGVEKDLAEAAGWYRRAAKAGIPQANEALMSLGFPGVM
ncbi:MAG: sel1 repeat family protein [Clostridia bacterium]|nr:sel1 repeat family protein [Clostridia bacterium]